MPPTSAGCFYLVTIEVEIARLFLYHGSMEIVIEKVEHKAYRPMFGGADIPMTVVAVRFPEHGVYMSLSHREDDPTDVWCADFRMDSNGYVHFSHGEGDRTCIKNFAQAELLDAIKAAL